MSIDQLNKVSTESVKKHTGKTWSQWIQTIDRAGGRSWTHKEIVTFLRKKFRPGPWWEQIVASGFEIHIGKKIEGQNAKGLFSLGMSKTLNVNRRRAWELLFSMDGLGHWLTPMDQFQIRVKSQYEVEGGIFGEVRTIKKPERIRLTWQDTEWVKPSVLQIHLFQRPGNKCVLGFQHDNLPTAAVKDLLKSRWRKALSDFAQFVLSQSKSSLDGPMNLSPAKKI